MIYVVDSCDAENLAISSETFSESVCVCVFTLSC